MLLNTLDRSLIRRNPSPSSVPEQSAPDVQPASRLAAARTSEPSSPDTRAGEKTAKPGTLDAFLVRRDATAEASTSGRADNRRQALPKSLFDRQLSGRLSQPASASCRHTSASLFQEVASLTTHAWGRTALSDHGMLSLHSNVRDGADSIQALQFDRGGELLLAGSSQGLLSVHSMQQVMQRLAQRGDGTLARGAHSCGSLDPLLLLDTGMWRLSSMRWNERDENVVGVASTATNQLRMYDLAHTQGRPRETLTVPQQSATLGLAGSVAVGLTDLALPGGGSGYTLLAGGVGGQVFLWDQRARNTPQACLQSPGTGAVNALQVLAGGGVVVAGTQSGEVKLWDLRGGSSGTLRFGGSLHHHPLLCSLSLRYALTAVPGLADQTAIPPTAVQWIQADPQDERRLGFHLGCGWSGVLDLSRHVITHLHAPPQRSTGDAEDHAGYAPTLHRRPCWSPDGTHLLTPCCHSDALHLLDCAPSRYAACAVLSAQGPPPTKDLAEREDGDWWDAGEGSQGGSQGCWRGSSRRGASQPTPPSAVQVPLSQPGACTAAHPRGALIVVGGREGRLGAVMSR